MSAEQPENNESPIESIGESLAENAIDKLGDALTGVPAPIRKNALKAFGQLCTALIDWPVAWLEGKTAELRAETQGRITLINSSAEQISKQMNVSPEYARVAEQKYAQRIVREQVNVDVICENAAKELEKLPEGKNNESEPSSFPEISSDWLNAFEQEGRNMSSDEMRLVFGKILAGEITKPGSYSIRTIKLVSQLDNKAAKLFQRCCSMSISMQLGGAPNQSNHIMDARVCSLGGQVGSNSLQKYGISYDQATVLNEYGLITPDFNSQMDYSVSLLQTQNIVAIPITHQGKFFALIPQGERQPNYNLRLNGITLSQSGKELLNAIDIEPCEEYTKALKDFFQRQKLQMVEINSTR